MPDFPPQRRLLLFRSLSPPRQRRSAARRPLMLPWWPLPPRRCRRWTSVSVPLCPRRRPRSCYPRSCLRVLRHRRIRRCCCRTFRLQLRRATRSRSLPRRGRRWHLQRRRPRKRECGCCLSLPPPPPPPRCPRVRRLLRRPRASLCTRRRRGHAFRAPRSRLRSSVQETRGAGPPRTLRTLRRAAPTRRRRRCSCSGSTH